MAPAGGVLLPSVAGATVAEEGMVEMQRWLRGRRTCAEVTLPGCTRPLTGHDLRGVTCLIAEHGLTL